jgi:hypothetical protein
MDEPPKLEEPIDELDNRMKRIKEANADDSALEDKYYRYPILRVMVLCKMLVGLCGMRNKRQLKGSNAVSLKVQYVCQVVNYTEKKIMPFCILQLM